MTGISHEKKLEFAKQSNYLGLKRLAVYNGKSMTGHGMNSASRFASTCFEWMASMLMMTRSKFRSSATSPMMAVGLFPSPSRSSNLNSWNPPNNCIQRVKSNARQIYVLNNVNNYLIMHATKLSLENTYIYLCIFSILLSRSTFSNDEHS